MLKSNGLLLIVVPHDLRHSNVLTSRDDRLNPDFPEFSYHVHNYNLETLEYLAKSTSFDVIKAERFDAVMSWRARWPRIVSILFSISLPLLPYFVFKMLDAKATKAGYPAMQALTLCVKKA